MVGEEDSEGTRGVDVGCALVDVTGSTVSGYNRPIWLVCACSSLVSLRSEVPSSAAQVLGITGLRG